MPSMTSASRVAFTGETPPICTSSFRGVIRRASRTGKLPSCFCNAGPSFHDRRVVPVSALAAGTVSAAGIRVGQALRDMLHELRSASHSQLLGDVVQRLEAEEPNPRLAGWARQDYGCGIVAPALKSRGAQASPWQNAARVCVFVALWPCSMWRNNRHGKTGRLLKKYDVPKPPLLVELLNASQLGFGRPDSLSHPLLKRTIAYST